MARLDVDGGRDPRADGAVFEAVRVRGATRSPWPFVALFAAVGGLTALGAAGGGFPGSADGDGGAVPEALTTSRPAVAAAATPRPALRPARTPRAGPLGGEQGGPPPPSQALAVDLKPAGSYLFVHGDVFDIAVDSVQVALLDSEGNVAATERVPMPGGSRSMWTSPNPRFDVHFAVADEMMGDGLSIEVSAFGADGARLATVLEPVRSRQVPF